MALSLSGVPHTIGSSRPMMGAAFASALREYIPIGCSAKKISAQEEETKH